MDEFTPVTQQICMHLLHHHNGSNKETAHKTYNHPSTKR